MNKELLGKYQGSFLDLSIGDTFGVPAEFKKVGDFGPVSDFRDSATEYASL